jgi:3-(3-hydroxy-phenyl)propionate hydroxylase
LGFTLQDALDLPGRLAAVLRGKAANELNGYEAARHPAGQRALQHTRAQDALSRNDDIGRALHEIVSELLLTSRSAARRLTRLVAD